ncbi:XkdQ/YqbQ family protein [Clostridium saccharobutylicum]|uniref:Cell wall-associated hydrolase n=1 Tax=Clostridium saccharobutylicum DSM 13864 TaxID=1345695 RepID=U5MTV7_CLOSA|nr:NlpC/P60 family protein [Clostridium saccharobutylicum]AGX43948.1 cell wall-associated hydrolase [Clostridium saccharobutylicum DSM 13864]AQR91246.1 gamma-D-glutamyl-L-lysine endopeptidase [Clostridium saccharobutylicum]AQS01150.1 gamma-D-glutamyl-L-lysine endopeptidase [Clostridium saccharobutylicum]AQS10563.1 gamma-D-glutamyl-L-lysine endopeptidase [Clostridium saccharobutylicum]AQS15133.1 gamma-D-glutamyl-L-lysine endopeptidase [Clostridium saccharobutylicum]
MIKVFCIYYGNTVEITNLCESIKISGSLTNVCRELDITMGYGVFNTNISRTDLSAGTLVWVTLDDEEIFRGKLIEDTLKTDDTLTFTAFDFAWYLKQDEVTFNFNGTTAEDATQSILDKVGVSSDYIYPTGIAINHLIAKQSPYDAIMEMYTQVKKQTGEKFYLWMSGDKVMVTQFGGKIANTIIKPCTQGLSYADGNLISFEYTETMANMVNRVEVYDNNNNKIDTVNSDSSVQNRYGIIQKNYVQEDGKDYKTVANQMLHNLDITIKCKVLGNYDDYFTGKGVTVQIPWINKVSNTVLYITEDCHTWDIGTGTYTSELTLNLEKVMDEKEYQESSNNSSSNSRSDVNAIVEYAKTFIGTPYVWGGTTPDGFDCSGFVQYVFNHFGYNLPRTTYEQIDCGSSVSQDELQPGDLVFPGTGHVQIYVGNGQVIHSPHTGESVCIIDMYGFYAGRRIVTDSSDSSSSSGDVDLSNATQMQMNLSFYTGAASEGGNESASGKTLQYGMCASNVYSFGTQFYITGIDGLDDGVFTVEDHGGTDFDSANRLDIYVGVGGDSVTKANNLGRQTVTAYKLN